MWVLHFGNGQLILHRTDVQNMDLNYLTLFFKTIRLLFYCLVSNLNKNFLLFFSHLYFFKNKNILASLFWTTFLFMEIKSVKFKTINFDRLNEIVEISLISIKKSVKYLN